MRILKKSFLTTAILLVMLISSVHATSWVNLTPEEVIERATIVVKGKYDFTKERKGSNTFWVGYDFMVDQVYKGNVTNSIIVGIDGYDKGWVDDIQRNDGSFVLFLEQAEGVDFLTPVGGPNGMVHIQNDEVQHSDDYKREIFSDFLKNTKTNIPDYHVEEDTKESLNYYVVAIISAVVMLIVLFIVSRRIKR